MNRPTRTPTSPTKVSVKRAAVFSRAKRGVKPIEKASPETDGPFASFTEWSGEADEKAYAKL
jgi:hypothetical protein